MRTTLLSLMCMLVITLLRPSAQAFPSGDKATEPALNNIDAVRAMAIANQWRWSRKDVKSYVTSREVVFEFSGGEIKRVSLPPDKMVVAIAPFVSRTHR